jgi:hypothetical protein
MRLIATWCGSVATVDVALVVIGFVTGMVGNMIVMALPKPTFEFRAFDNEPDTANDWKFVNVEVTNKRRPWWSRFRDSTAELVTAWVEISSEKEAPPLFPAFSARWPGYEAQPIAGGQPDMNAVLIPYRETLPPGEPFPINVAIKHEGDTGFFGFNNRSYLDPSLRDREKRVSHERAFVRVVLRVGGSLESSPWFELQNPDASLARFTIEHD